MRKHLISQQLVHAMSNMATATVSVQFVDEDVLKLKGICGLLRGTKIQVCKVQSMIGFSKANF